MAKAFSPSRSLRTLLLAGTMLVSGFSARANESKGSNKNFSQAIEQQSTYDYVTPLTLFRLIEQAPEASNVPGVSKTEVAVTMVGIARHETIVTGNGFVTDAPCADPASSAKGLFQITAATEQTISAAYGLPLLDREHLNRKDQVRLQARYAAALFDYNYTQAKPLAEKHLGKKWNGQEIRVEDAEGNQTPVILNASVLVSAAHMGLGNLETVLEGKTRQGKAFVLHPQIEDQDFSRHFTQPYFDMDFKKAAADKHLVAIAQAYLMSRFNYNSGFAHKVDKERTAFNLSPQMAVRMSALVFRAADSVKNGIGLNEGWRNHSRQRDLHSKNPDKAGAEDKSLHPKGGAVDLHLSSAAQAYLDQNCSKYDLEHDQHVVEPWHYQLKGESRREAVEASKHMDFEQVAPREIELFQERKQDEVVADAKPRHYTKGGANKAKPTGGDGDDDPPLKKEGPKGENAYTDRNPNDRKAKPTGEPVPDDHCWNDHDSLHATLPEATFASHENYQSHTAQDRSSAHDYFYKSMADFFGTSQGFGEKSYTADDAALKHMGRTVKIDGIKYTVDHSFIRSMQQAYGENATTLLEQAVAKHRENRFRVNYSYFDKDSDLAKIMHGPRFAFDGASNLSFS